MADDLLHTLRNMTTAFPPPPQPPSLLVVPDLAAVLQGEYSTRVYGSPGRVELSALRVLWLDLLSESSLRLLQCSGRLCQLAFNTSEPSCRTTVGGLRPECLLLPARQVAPCRGNDPQALFALPHSWIDNPMNSAWLLAASTQALPSFGWTEVTHCSAASELVAALSPSSRAQSNVWLYVAPGSGISVNVGKTLAIHEPHAVASGIFGADKDQARHRLSRALDALRRGAEPPLVRALHEYLKLAHALDSAAVGRLDSIQRLEHTELFSPEKFHELILLDPRLSDADTLRSAAASAPDRVRCGRQPHLHACDEDHPGLRAMDRCSTRLSAPVLQALTRVASACDRTPPPSPPVVETPVVGSGRVKPRINVVYAVAHDLRADLDTPHLRALAGQEGCASASRAFCQAPPLAPAPPSPRHLAVLTSRCSRHRPRSALHHELRGSRVGGPP